MSERTFPQAAFLGLAERAALVHDGETDALKWNVLGLKNHLLTYFFPISLSGCHLAIAMRMAAIHDGLQITFKADSGEAIGWVNIGLVPAVGEVPLTRSDSIVMQHSPQAWSVAFFLFPEGAPIVPKPGRYSAVLKENDKDEEIIGEFSCVLIDPPPLTPERVAAIKSNRDAVQAVRAVFGCPFCHSQRRVYAALEPMPALEAEGFTWYQDIPEQFTCECGKTQLDLRTVKRNFFALLGQPHTVSGQVSYMRLYEKTTLESLRVEFVGLINADPPEESIQKFIEKNPILLHQFPAERLLFKPPILTRFKADFAVVTPQKELILIEIERPGTRLLKRDGGQHAELTHAIDQAQSWLHEADEHRQAMLDSLQVPREAVGKVREVVIAGRDAGNDANHLRRLKGSDQGRVTFLTYDDLAAGLAALVQNMGDL